MNDLFVNVEQNWRLARPGGGQAVFKGFVRRLEYLQEGPPAGPGLRTMPPVVCEIQPTEMHDEVSTAEADPVAAHVYADFLEEEGARLGKDWSEAAAAMREKFPIPVTRTPADGPSQKIRVGSRVRCVWPAASHFGHEGVVQCIKPENVWPYWVKWSHGSGRAARGHLEIVATTVTAAEAEGLRAELADLRDELASMRQQRDDYAARLSAAGLLYNEG